MGWRSRERSELLARIRPDLVLALAVLHHISIARNVPLPQIAEWMVDTGADYRLGTYDWFSRSRFELGDTLPKPPATPPVEAAWRAPCLRGMTGWVRYPWVEVEADGEGWVVWVMDARYTRSRTTSFGGSRVRLRGDLTPDCDDRGDLPADR